MTKKNIHYPGHLIQYSMINSEIESLNAGTVMLGDLEKVGWIVLKSEYNITQSCDLKNALYDLNDDHSTKKTKWYLIDEKERQIFF